MEEWAAWERTEFTAEEIAALREPEAVLIKGKGLRWLYAEPEQVGRVAALAGFPRSVAGARQGDSLLRQIFNIKRECQNPNFVRLKIFEIASKEAISPGSPEILAEMEKAPKGHFFHVAARLHKFLNPGVPFQPKTDSEFFSAIAVCLEHLETYTPTKEGQVV